MAIFYIVIAFLAGLGTAWFLLKAVKKLVRKNKGTDNVRDFNKKAGDRKEERKAKILEMFKKAPQGRLRNDDVEKAIGVSDASVTNYFDELEREGKVRQVGKGTATYYELK